VVWEAVQSNCVGGTYGQLTKDHYTGVSFGGGTFGNASMQKCRESCANNADCHMYSANHANSPWPHGSDHCWHYIKKQTGTSQAVENERRRLPSYNKPHYCHYKYGVEWTVDHSSNIFFLFVTNKSVY
jgi:hypothetical protein